MEKEIPEDLLITLESLGGFGNPIAYKLTINHQGEVTFEEVFVKVESMFRGRISLEKVKELIEDFKSINFFELRKQYMNEADGCMGMVTCQPQETLSIQINGKCKTVHHDLGCEAVNVSKNLHNLAKKIDRITNSHQWIEKVNLKYERYFKDKNNS